MKLKRKKEEFIEVKYLPLSVVFERYVQISGEKLTEEEFESLLIKAGLDLAILQKKKGGKRFKGLIWNEKVERFLTRYHTKN